MSVSVNPPETTVKVNVSTEVITGVYQVVSTFDIKFEKAYLSMEDTELLAAISEKLSSIPA